MPGDEVWTPLFAEELWGSNFSALSHSWTTRSLSPPAAGTSQTLQLPHPNHQITRGLCVIYARALASNTWALAVWPAPKYFCLWSSAPSFNSRDNICHRHTFRPERMFIMLSKKKKKSCNIISFLFWKKKKGNWTKKNSIYKIFKENIYKRAGEKSRGQMSTLTVAFYGWQDDEQFLFFFIYRNLKNASSRTISKKR